MRCEKRNKTNNLLLTLNLACILLEEVSGAREFWVYLLRLQPPVPDNR